MGARQQTGLKSHFAIDQRMFDVDRSNHAVFRGTERQIYDGRTCKLGRPRLAERVSNLHLWQEGGEGPNRRGLASSPVSERKDTANQWINGGDQ